MNDSSDDSVRPDADPLLEFAVEPAPIETDEPLSSDVAVTESPASEAITTDQVPIDRPHEDAAEVMELRGRLKETDLALTYSAERIATLEAEVATLVATIEDITQRLNQKTEPPTPRHVPTRARPRTALTAAAVLVAAFLVWAVQSGPETGGPTMEPLQASADPDEAPPSAEAGEDGASAAADLPAAEPDEPPTPEAPSPAPQTAQTTGAPARVPGTQAGGPTRFIGTLSVQSAPGGGTVFLNRKNVGTAPVQLSGLRAGSHLVWVEREGYRRWTRVVLVPANQVTRVNAALEVLER